MTNWVEYYYKKKEIVRIVGSYVPKQGEMVYIKLLKIFNSYVVDVVVHEIDKTSLIKEKFKVYLK